MRIKVSSGIKTFMMTTSISLTPLAWRFLRGKLHLIKYQLKHVAVLPFCKHKPLQYYGT